MNWDNGKTTAVATVQQNSADQLSLADFTVANVQAGYWDMSWTRSTAPANLLGYTDPASFVPTTDQMPAVKVTVAKTQGGTGSSAPVSTYFASMMGIDSMGVQASAVAILPPPTGVSPGDCFPMAHPDTFVNQLWERDHRSPSASAPPITFLTGANGPLS